MHKAHIAIVRLDAETTRSMSSQWTRPPPAMDGCRCR